MLRRHLLSFLAVGLISASAWSAAGVGSKAPDFTLPGTDGKPYHLADYKGKYVVLEWYNTGCPFIRKHYDSGNMQKLQEAYGKKGVVWFSVSSSAPGKEGYLTGAEAEADRVKNQSKATAVLLDPEGKVGRLYQAKTTPHMFVINPSGEVIYNGAIDDVNSTDPADTARAKNFVASALDQAQQNKAVETKQTKPYGCGVKYAK